VHARLKLLNHALLYGLAHSVQRQLTCTTLLRVFNDKISKQYSEEDTRNTPESQRQSEHYNKGIRAATLQHAILTPLKQCCELQRKLSSQKASAQGTESQDDDIFGKVMYEHFVHKKAQVCNI
jgi:hypothetical protein